MNNEFIEVGKILKTKGFDGTTVVEFNYPISNHQFKAFFIQKGSQYIPLLIAEKNPVDDLTHHIKWTNYENKEKAVSLNNTHIYLQENVVATYFDTEILEDVIGYQVLNRDTNLGKVINLYDNGQQETIEVELSNGKRLLIPFVEEYVELIDDDSQTIICQLEDEFIEIFSH